MDGEYVLLRRSEVEGGNHERGRRPSGGVIPRCGVAVDELDPAEAVVRQAVARGVRRHPYIPTLDGTTSPGGTKGRYVLAWVVALCGSVANGTAARRAR